MPDILLRWAVAFALVAATYNPTHFNFVRWAITGEQGTRSLVLLVGLVLLAVWIIFLRATLRSIGPFGMALVAGIFVAAVWVMHDLGVLALENRAFTAWLGIAGASLVLGVGLGWSHIRRRITGQTDVDDVDES